jgi:hypothetical protein
MAASNRAYIFSMAAIAAPSSGCAQARAEREEKASIVQRGFIRNLRKACVMAGTAAIRGRDFRFVSIIAICDYDIANCD